MAELTITAANVATDSAPERETAGDTVTRMMPLYEDSADSNHYKPCDNSTAAKADVKGVALCDVDDGQYVLVARSGDTVTVGATVTPETTYVIASTAGKIEPIEDLGSGEFISVLGQAINTTQIKLNFTATGQTHA